MGSDKSSKRLRPQIVQTQQSSTGQNTPFSRDARSSDNFQSVPRSVFSSQNSDTGPTHVSEVYCRSGREVVYNTERRVDAEPTAYTRTASSEGQSRRYPAQTSHTSIATDIYMAATPHSGSPNQRLGASPTDLMHVGAWVAPGQVPPRAPTPPELNLPSPRLRESRLSTPDIPLLSIQYQFCSCCPGSRHDNSISDNFHMGDRSHMNQQLAAASRYIEATRQSGRGRGSRSHRRR